MVSFITNVGKSHVWYFIISSILSIISISASIPDNFIASSTLAIIRRHLPHLRPGHNILILQIMPVIVCIQSSIKYDVENPNQHHRVASPDSLRKHLCLLPGYNEYPKYTLYLYSDNSNYKFPH